MILAELVHHVGLIGEECPHKKSKAKHHPFDFHTHTHCYIDSDDSYYAEPSGTAIGEEESYEKKGEKCEEEESRPPFAGTAEDEIEAGGKEEGDDATVGGVVVVEGPHGAVEGLKIAHVGDGLHGGDEHHDDEAYGVAPEELADALGVAEDLHGGEEEGHHEPKTS